MGDVAEHHAALGPMEDQPDVSAGTGRPEVFVLNDVEPVALEAWISRVDLKLEGGEFGGLLLLSIELLKAGLEAVGQEECHEEQRGAIGRLPNALESRKGTQLFVGCDQRPAAGECSGRDEAIRRIPVLK